MANEFLDDTKKRLSYLFSDSKKSPNCESFKGHKEHISKFLNCIIKKPLLSDRILKNYSFVTKGNFGNIFKSDIDHEFLEHEFLEEKENYSVVLKENKNYVEDVNEIFINQVRINDEVIYNNNPNFPILISYILCNPNIGNKPICKDSVIEIEKYNLDEINIMIKNGIIKLYGIYEYINGKNLLNYISNLTFVRLSDLEKWQFLKAVLMQVFSSLHCLTKSGKYTHNDLHLGNIMITEENLNNTYELKDSVKLTINDPFKCFIIDQGLANVQFEGQNFIYQNNSDGLPFLESFDIFKLIIKLYISLATDNISINKLFCKKLRSLLKILFNNPNSDIDYIISYIESNVNSKNGDVLLYHKYLVGKKIDKKDIDIIYDTIINLSYNDIVDILLKEEELFDISREKDIPFKDPSKSSIPSIPSKTKKPVAIIIKGKKI